ncbi:hypothetical protein DYQ93_18605 [Xanthomonas sp. LMG 8992]|uniref:hypothetical protein n=1 Tax=Xanthomonas sp. LMG 8992 TaxID=1591157 RepID=UPI00136B756E|nr:hypothetical protein [Xanthomonas sp. LMG 8992]MXV13029.1 hypothetical protein [Xanthomonas sp. LMG 8992]
MNLSRIGIGTTILALSFLGVGYLTARLSLASCADASFQEARSKGISGRDMLGNKVAPTRDSVTASIAGPYLVRTQYGLPLDLHGTIHTRRYVVLPWRVAAYASEVIRLVDATSLPADDPIRSAGAQKRFVQLGIGLGLNIWERPGRGRYLARLNALAISTRSM